MGKVRDKKLAKKYWGLPCRVCGTTYGTVGAHLKTVGAHPRLAKDARNIMPLCDYHHKEQEQNLAKFVNNYSLDNEMISRGFYYCPYNNDWYLPYQDG